MGFLGLVCIGSKPTKKSNDPGCGRGIVVVVNCVWWYCGLFGISDDVWVQNQQKSNDPSCGMVVVVVVTRVWWCCGLFGFSGDVSVQNQKNHQMTPVVVVVK